jgi:hypothetical protein
MPRAGDVSVSLFLGGRGLCRIGVGGSRKYKDEVFCFLVVFFSLDVGFRVAE